MKFKEHAKYPDGSGTGLSGKEADMLCAAEVAKQKANLGGEFVFASDANTLVIGDGELE